MAKLSTTYIQTEPIAHYVGGSVVKIDYVVAKQLNLNSLKNSTIEYFGEPLGMRRYYILMNNSFMVMNIDEDVKVWVVKHTPLREMVVFIEDGEDLGNNISVSEEDMGNCVTGADLSNNVSISEEDMGNIKERNGKGKSVGGGSRAKGKSVFDSSRVKGKSKSVQGLGGKGKSISHLVDEDDFDLDDERQMVDEDSLGRKDDGDRQVEMDNSNLDDFTDSDYNIDEESESENDDVLFEKNVYDNRISAEHSESSKSSEESDGVLCYANNRDFNENKDSDGEQNELSVVIFNPDVTFEPEFELGMIFSARDEFKKVVQSYAIKTKRSIKFTKTAPTRVYAKCSDDDCGWKAHLIKVDGEESFQIRQYEGRHTCVAAYRVKNLKSTWLSEKFIKKFVADPKRRVSGFRQDVIDELEIDVTKEHAYRARRLALKKLQGNPGEQFSKLWDYAEELKRSNPNSIVIVGSVEDDNGLSRFSNFYVCLDAVKKGFKAGCRPIIGVDGCHLKGPHKGILLTVVSVDANNSLYPIAWAVVTTESKDTWEWFLICLKHDLEIYRAYEYTFMSDKQKGLIQAFAEVFPDSPHRFCVRHLHGNFKLAGFKGLVYKQALWRAANASTIADWKEKMLELKELNEVSWKWLDDKPANQWSKSHFNEHPKCDMLLNNVCESFNSSILPAREMPILTMLEWIREWLMVRFQYNRDVASVKWKRRICPRIKRILEKHAENSVTCRPIKADDIHYQIRYTDGSQYCVNLEEHTCSCRLWELSGIPCNHAIFAIIHQRGDMEEYVSEWYTVDTYRKSYASTIKGINGPALWSETFYIPPLPPNMGRGKGRPARARRNEPDEPKVKTKKSGRGKKPTKLKRRQVTVTCTTCGYEGHNSISCGRDDPMRKKRSTSNKNEGIAEANEEHISVVNPLSRMDNQGLTLLPPMPLTQETTSEICEPCGIPTQQSQVEQVSNQIRVPGPSPWDQLQQSKKSRVQIGGPSPSSGKKFIHLSSLQKQGRFKK